MSLTAQFSHRSQFCKSVSALRYGRYRYTVHKRSMSNLAVWIAQTAIPCIHSTDISRKSTYIKWVAKMQSTVLQKHTHGYIDMQVWCRNSLEVHMTGSIICLDSGDIPLTAKMQKTDSSLQQAFRLACPLGNLPSKASVMWKSRSSPWNIPRKLEGGQSIVRLMPWIRASHAETALFSTRKPVQIWCRTKIDVYQLTRYKSLYIHSKGNLKVLILLHSRSSNVVVKPWLCQFMTTVHIIFICLDCIDVPLKRLTLESYWEEASGSIGGKLRTLPGDIC